LMVTAPGSRDACVSAVQLLLLADVPPRTAAGSSPTVLTQYPTAQKCSPTTRRSRSGSRWMRTALVPWRKHILLATLYLGGMFRHRWTWSGRRVPLDQLDAALPAQVADDPADLPAQVAVQGLAPVVWYDEHHVIPWSPTGRGPAIPIRASGSPVGHGPWPGPSRGRTDAPAGPGSRRTGRAY
jgi:hypothetical protein